MSIGLLYVPHPLIMYHLWVDHSSALIFIHPHMNIGASEARFFRRLYESAFIGWSNAPGTPTHKHCYS